jgi:hypothetical protein
VKFEAQDFIDYNIVSDAISFYQSRGYEYIEVPWIISKDAYYATKPPDSVDVSAMGGYLAASGEQGFLELLLAGQKITKAVCATPCFRHEQWDKYHQPYFFKVELINTLSPMKGGGVMPLEKDATEFFSRYLKTRVSIVQEGATLVDIVSDRKGIELGSYGKRYYKGIIWHFGTGVALPRLTQAILEEGKIEP